MGLSTCILGVGVCAWRLRALELARMETGGRVRPRARGNLVQDWVLARELARVGTRRTRKAASVYWLCVRGGLHGDWLRVWRLRLRSWDALARARWDRQVCRR